MIINQKIRLNISKETAKILDSQSLMCNKVYNELLELCNEDKKTNYQNKYLEGRNLRDEVVKIKERYPYLYAVHSSPLKNVAFRLKQAFIRFFESKKNGTNQNGYPNFRSNKRKWFSLLYDEPNKGIKIHNKQLKISLGYKINENQKKERLYVNAILTETIKKQGIIKCYRITKERNAYYLIVTMEYNHKITRKETNKVISIDQNHTNFFVGIDNERKSVEFDNLYMIKYFDKEIDKVKSKRDKCNKKAHKCISKYGTEYTKPSRRYIKLDKAVKNLCLKRESQIKTALYTIANKLCKEYDEIVIGDYVPSMDTAIYKNMHRTMLNQSVIGQFRKILEHTAQKMGVRYQKINEIDTTKRCHVCGNMEKHDPSVRSFTCPKCGTTMNRDINSAINIGIKAKILSSSDYVGIDLTKPMYKVRYSLHKQAVCAYN